MREDFCGTSLLCCEWVKGAPDRSATGVDIDKKVLAWGKANNHSAIGDDAKRITLLQQDVREPSPGRFDIVCAFNFSYWVFKTRDELRKYFASVRKGLGREGLFLLDAYGGWESQEPMFEPRKIKGGFTYVWDQDKFDPITHGILNHIHFEFKDGTKLEKAFTYEWRYWTLPEIQELLREAGFSDVRVYWDTSDDNDVERYRVRNRADNQPGWLAYLVAVR
jgi:SAM-dependent methyltransferase